MKTSAILALAACFCLGNAAAQTASDIRSDVMREQIKAELKALIEHQQKVSTIMLELELQKTIAAAQGNDTTQADRTFAALERHRSAVQERVAAATERLVEIQAQLPKSAAALDTTDEAPSDLEASGAERQKLVSDLERLRNHLAKLQIRYTDKWPDVVRAKARIATLERRLSELEGSGSKASEQ